MKTKLGIGIGFAASIIYLSAYFGLSGYVVPVLIAGYVLVNEENDFLRRSAVKAVGTLLLFSVVVALINFIPDLFGIIDNIMSIFGSNERFSAWAAPSKINQILNFIINLLNICKKVLFLLLALKAVRLQTIRIPVVDGLIDKFVPKKEA